MVKDKAFYLRMAQEMEEKEKTRAYVAHVKSDHQVWSSEDEDENFDNIKGKGKICMAVTTKKDGSTKLERN